MSKNNNNPCSIAESNFTARCRDHWTHGGWPKHYSFSRLKPGKSAILFILGYIKQHPHATRAQVELAYGRCISCNTWQSLTWGELLTPRKYEITQLGRDLLKQYGCG